MAAASIFVTNLPPQCTEREIWQSFRIFGKVLVCHHYSDTGTAIVVYVSSGSVRRAMEQTTKIYVATRQVRITSCNSFQTPLEAKCTLYVSELGIGTTVSFVEFLLCGIPFLNISMQQNGSGQTRGYAFIKFASAETRDAATAKLSGMMVNGRALKVNSAFIEME